MLSIDLNCDLGEGFGNEKQIMPLISSANIACGEHAGDPRLIRDTILLAKKYGVAIGAHPSFPDRTHFGRLPMRLSPDEIYQVTRKQIETVARIVSASHAVLRHVKPHGALYNMAAFDEPVADAIISAVCDVNRDLLLYGLSGSLFIRKAKKAGLRGVQEAFADRSYQNDGSLTARGAAGAMIENPEEASDRVIKLVSEGKLRSLSGNEINIQADTICIHGDQPNAPEMARIIRQRLTENGIEVNAPGFEPFTPSHL